MLSDRWRHFARAHEGLTDDSELPGIDDNIERRAMLYELVNTLPADQRQVILWRFVDRKSLREVATELGRSEGAIKQLQLRALRNLRDRIAAPKKEGRNHV